MKPSRNLPLFLLLRLIAVALLLPFAGCTAVSEEDGEYTPPPLPASSIGRLRPDANLTPGP